MVGMHSPAPVCLGLAKNLSWGRFILSNFRFVGQRQMTLAARESPQAAEVLASYPTWARPKSMWECTDPEDPGV